MIELKETNDAKLNSVNDELARLCAEAENEASVWMVAEMNALGFEAHLQEAKAELFECQKRMKAAEDKLADPTELESAYKVMTRYVDHVYDMIEYRSTLTPKEVQAFKPADYGAWREELSFSPSYLNNPLKDRAEDGGVAASGVTDDFKAPIPPPPC